MYLPKHFHEPNTSVMQDFMRAHPLAAVITLNDNRIEANHIPLMVFNDPLPYGVLQGHIARANPIWYEHPTDSEVLTIFQGIESYISPSWYASKQETGKVVPTWNYVSVHARGKLRVIDDAHWLRHHLESMVSHHEKKCKHAPWKLTDAPDDFIAMQIKSIIGIEIVITELQGKWKVSQNRLPQDRKSLADALRNNGRNDMADLVCQRNENNP